MKKPPKKLLIFNIVLLTIAALAALVVTMYWIVRFSGLYRMIVQLQLRFTDVYYPASTAIITFGLLMILFCVPLVILNFVLSFRKQ